MLAILLTVVIRLVLYIDLIFTEELGTLQASDVGYTINTTVSAHDFTNDRLGTVMPLPKGLWAGPAYRPVSNLHSFPICLCRKWSAKRFIFYWNTERLLHLRGCSSKVSICIIRWW